MDVILFCDLASFIIINCPCALTPNVGASETEFERDSALSTRRPNSTNSPFIIFSLILLGMQSPKGLHIDDRACL